MKISYSWLKRYIHPAPSPSDTAEILTNTGLETESIEKFESIQGGLEGLVTGRILECKKHPHADRLSLTLVDIKKDHPLQIVCGAPNVQTGLHVIVATIGTTLYPADAEPFSIKESKIRGEISQGMICSEKEIGIGESHEGIIILPDNTPVGVPASEFYGISSDFIFEIGLTPNRIDAASHYGTARDLRAALYSNDQIKLTIPEIRTQVDFKIPSPVKLIVENPEAVIRYSGICIENITVSESPAWLKQSLRSIGLKPINNIVDITNFVLHETGQPLHAFDRHKIQGDTIVLRTLPEGTTFSTLDGIERKISSSDLMICDQEKPMCIAGVFGGIQSGVGENTTSVFLESATFHPGWIRKTSSRHNLKTDAAFRFERGADPEMTHYAMLRATDLILECAGGNPEPGILDWYPNPIAWAEIRYPWWKLDRLTGFHIPRDVAKKILILLEIQIIEEDSDGLTLRIPPFKNDVKSEEDVTEEIIRIYGYNRIPEPVQLRTSPIVVEKPDTWKLKNHISEHLVALGFTEVMTNSLSDISLTRLTLGQNEEPVEVLNPLSSELGAMRSSSFSGLCETISWNKNRQQNDLSVFEWGKTYAVREGRFQESTYLAMAQTGFATDIEWNRQQISSGYFSLKGICERICNLLNLSVEQITFSVSANSALEDCITVFFNEKAIGLLGSLNQTYLKSFELESPIWVAQLNWDMLLDAHKKTAFSLQEISRFPHVKRDLSLLLDSNIQFDDLVRIARKTEKKILRNINLFDVYQGKNLPVGKKSYAISFTFINEEKTLTDEQIHHCMERLIKAFKNEAGAELREN